MSMFEGVACVKLSSTLKNHCASARSNTPAYCSYAFRLAVVATPKGQVVWCEIHFLPTREWSIWLKL